MSGNPTIFVAMPMTELLALIEEMIYKGLENYTRKETPKPSEELLSTEETCKFLRVSKVTIHKWKKQKRIVAHRIGRRIFFKKHELLKAMR